MYKISVLICPMEKIKSPYISKETNKKWMAILQMI